MRHQATHRNPRIRVEKPNHRLKDRTPNIFKIHIHAIGANLSQFLNQVLAPMADTRIEPQCIYHVPAFLFGACNADHAASFNLGNLPNDRPNCAGCRRHHHSFTRHGLADVHKANIGSQTRHAQYAERR